MASNFEDEFGEMALDEVKKIIDAAAASLSMNEIAIEEAEKRDEELNFQISLLRAQIADLQAERRALDLSNYDRRVQIRKDRKLVETGQAKIELIQENLDREAALATKLAELEKIAQQFKWYDYLYRHQKEAVFFLASARRAVLADVPGLGKTLTSLAWCQEIDAQRSITITPAEVQRGFMKEIEAWTPELEPLKLGQLRRNLQFQYLEYLLATGKQKFHIVMNYQTLTNGSKKDLDRLMDLLLKLQADTIIIDEAHLIKNLKTVAFKQIKRLMMENNKYGPLSDHELEVYKAQPGSNFPRNSIVNSLMMTGTPILNRPTDLYPMLHLTHPNIFYSEAMFQNEFCTYQWRGDSKVWVLRPGGKASLQRKLAGFYLRRTYDDAGIVLPPQEIITHDLVLKEAEYPQQMKIINMLREQMAMQITPEGEVKNINNTLTLLLRERQACTWPGGIKLREPVIDPMTGQPKLELDDNFRWVEVMREVPVGDLYKESIKIDRAIEIFEESRENGQRVIFVSKFKECLKEIERRLGSRIVRYDGDLNGKDQFKADIQEDFLKTNDADKPRNADGEIIHRWEGVALNYDSAGFGLTLTGATVMIILDSEWNEGKNDQAWARIQRIGQDEGTQVHRLIVRGTADNFLERLVEIKSQIVAGFNDTMKAHMNEVIKMMQQKLTDESGEEDNDDE